MTRLTKALAVTAIVLAMATVAAVIGANALLDAKGRDADADRVAALARAEDQTRRFAAAVVRAGEPAPDRAALAVAAEAGPVAVVMAEPDFVVTVRSETTFRVLFGVEHVEVCYAVRFEGLGTGGARFSISTLHSCPP
jgi:hypothetical protein